LYHGLTKGYDSGFAKFVSVNMTDMRDKIEEKKEVRHIQVKLDYQDIKL